MTSTPGTFTPPTVTLAALLEAASHHANAHRWSEAEALLTVIAERFAHPTLTAYRALVAALELVAPHRPQAERDALWAMEGDTRSRLYDLLTRNPNTPAATGKETF